MEIPTESVDVAPENMSFEEEYEENEDLKKNIVKLGLLQDIIVRKEGDKYLVILGRDRFFSMKNAGFKTIPVKVVDVKGYHAMLMSASENFHRKNINPIAKARFLKRMLDESGKSQRELARDLNLSKSLINDLITLLQLDFSLQKLLEDGSLPYTDALKIAHKNYSLEDQRKIAGSIKKGTLMEDIRKIFKFERRGAPRGLHVLRFTWGDDERRIEQYIYDEAVRMGVKPGDYAKGLLKDAVIQKMKEAL